MHLSQSYIFCDGSGAYGEIHGLLKQIRVQIKNMYIFSTAEFTQIGLIHPNVWTLLLRK